jgi:hypothetical protein
LRELDDEEEGRGPLLELSPEETTTLGGRAFGEGATFTAEGATDDEEEEEEVDGAAVCPGGGV